MISDLVAITVTGPTGPPPPVRIVSLHDYRREAADLFYEVAHDPSSAMFRPHALTEQYAYAMSWERDVYVLAIDASQTAFAYGMLRGWDEGYEIPSLGIVVCRAARGTGIARLMMQHLHVCARLRGATTVRLRVHPDNNVAIGLYRSMGYQFSDEIEEDQYVGQLDLIGRRP